MLNNSRNNSQNYNSSLFIQLVDDNYISAVESTLLRIASYKDCDINLSNIFSSIIGSIHSFLDKTHIQCNKIVYLKYLNFIISHLQAVNHFLALLQGNSIFAQSVSIEIDNLINQGNIIIKNNPLIILNYANKIQNNNNEKGSIVLAKEDDYELELMRKTEQEKLDSRQDLHSKQLLFLEFLIKIWKYALSDNHSKYKSKKIFISYAWPEKDKHQEEWTKQFIENLARHLAYAGIKVYLDDFQSGGGFDLARFMGIIKDVDHVLIISSRTMEYKLKIPESGVCCEYQEIKKYLQNHSNLITNRFIIPILLNHKNYCHDDFKGLAEISFFKEDYLNAFRSLIKTIYGFNSLTFNKWWNKALIKCKINNNWWNVSQQNLNFTGRDKLLGEIESFFNGSENSLAITACHGLGGVGKTQIALQYVHTHAHLYSFIFWFDASSYQNLINSYAILYTVLKKERKIISSSEELYSIALQAQAVKNWLENNAPENWLAIYDNALNYPEIKKLLPSKGGKILVTSRHIEWPGRSMMVDVFSLAEALAFAKKIIGNSKVESEIKNLHLLVEKLGRLPLALAQAFAYIARTGISVADYNSIYEKKRELLLQDNLLPVGDEHEPVFITFDITMERMQQEAPESIELLKSVISIDNENIPVEFSDALFNEDDLVLAKLTSNKARRIAKEYSMINYNEVNQVISLHTLVHQILQDKFKAELNNYLPKAIIALHEAYNAIDADLNNKLRLNNYLVRHIKKALEIFDRHVLKNNLFNKITEPTQLKLLLTLLINLCNIYESFGHINEIIEIASRFLETAKINYPGQDQALFMPINFLAHGYRKQGNLSKAKEILKSVLIKAEDEIEFDSDNIQTLESLASLLRELGDYQKSITLYKRIIQHKETSADNNESSVLLVKNNLANSYGAQGNLKTQIEILEQSLPKMEKYYEPNHPELAIFYNNLGSAYIKNGNIVKGKALLLKALAINKSIYGEDSLAVLNDLNNLSSYYFKANEIDKQLETLEEAYKIIQRKGYVSLPLAAVIMLNLGRAYLFKLKFGTGLTYIRKAYQIFNTHKDYGPLHPQTLEAFRAISGAVDVLIQVKGEKYLTNILGISSDSLVTQISEQKNYDHYSSINRSEHLQSSHTYRHPSFWSQSDTVVKEEAQLAEMDDELQAAIDLSLQPNLTQHTITDNANNEETDAELQAAINLSLQPIPKRTEPASNDANPEEMDDELQAAIRLSLQ